MQHDIRTVLSTTKNRQILDSHLQAPVGNTARQITRGHLSVSDAAADSDPRG